MTFPSSRVGSTQTMVTSLGFGGAAIGNLFSAVDPAAAEAAIVTAWEGGVRYFDTAPHYGLGLSEQRLGRALKGFRRADYTISTKVGRLLVPNARPTARTSQRALPSPTTSPGCGTTRATAYCAASRPASSG